MNPSSDNGWNEHKRLIAESLKDGKVERARIAAELTDLRIAFEGFSQSMKAKAGVWGALAGLIPALGVLLVLVLKG